MEDELKEEEMRKAEDDDDEEVMVVEEKWGIQEIEGILKLEEVK